MNEDISRFDTLKIATQYWHGDPTTTTMIVIIFFLALAIFFVAGFLLQKKLKEKNVRRYFETFAKERELTPEEMKILWEYSQKMERDPILVLEFKAPFEKVVDLYIQNDPHAKEELVKDMRKKLGFEVQSPFIPLITTKDIEIFQNGRMIFSNNRTISVALYDKDERFMYWLAVDGDMPLEVHPGESVKIVFVRQDDGIYSFELPIVDIYQESGKTVVKLPHTFDLIRTQRREHPRIKLQEPATLLYLDEEGEHSFESTVVDIGPGGARVCAPKSDDKLKRIRYGEPMKLVVHLNKKRYTLEGKVLERDIKSKVVCFRLLFEGIDSEVKEEILEFVQKEQLKLAQLQKQQ